MNWASYIYIFRNVCMWQLKRKKKEGMTLTQSYTIWDVSMTSIATVPCQWWLASVQLYLLTPSNCSCPPPFKYCFLSLPSPFIIMWTPFASWSQGMLSQVIIPSNTLIPLSHYLHVYFPQHKEGKHVFRHNMDTELDLLFHTPHSGTIVYLYHATAALL